MEVHGENGVELMGNTLKAHTYIYTGNGVTDEEWNPKDFNVDLFLQAEAANRE